MLFTGSFRIQSYQCYFNHLHFLSSDPLFFHLTTYSHSFFYLQTPPTSLSIFKPPFLLRLSSHHLMRQRHKHTDLDNLESHLIAPDTQQIFAQMCQVIPFTLPCCRGKRSARVYVEVSRLPSCPDEWPKIKCPPELCLQVRGFEPEDRKVGTCWRCQAEEKNKSFQERESMRPGLDKAEIAVGLEEIPVQERREIFEDDGQCWFCHSTGGCPTCGAKRTSEITGRVKVDEDTATPATSATKRLREPEVNNKSEGRKGKRRAKNSVRVKGEDGNGESSTAPSSATPSSLVHQQQPYYINNNQHSSPLGFSPPTAQHGNPFSPLNHTSRDFGNMHVGSPGAYGMHSPYPELAGSPSGNHWYPQHHSSGVLPATQYGLPGTPTGGWQSLNDFSSPVIPQSETHMTPGSHGTANNEDSDLNKYDPALMQATPPQGGFKDESSPIQVPMAPVIYSLPFLLVRVLVNIFAEHEQQPHRFYWKRSGFHSFRRRKHRKPRFWRPFSGQPFRQFRFPISTIV